MFKDYSDATDEFALALVTGATSGIGLALCRLLAGKGINLIIHGRDAVKLSSLAEELSDNVQVKTVLADLATTEGQQVVADLIAKLKPDLVINNAGFGLYGAALNYTTEEQLEILEVDGLATVRLTLEAARALIANQRKGVIMNISSAAAFIPFPNFALYSATKAMVNHFSESFDEETRSAGVRVLAACPGVVRTNFRSRAGGKEDIKKNSIKPMTSEFAANEIWHQIIKGKKVHIFNWKYRCAIYLSRFLPKSYLARIMKNNVNRIQSP